MAEQIEQRTAQQIVDTVKEVCGYNINFIRPDGSACHIVEFDPVGRHHNGQHRSGARGYLS